MKIISGKGRILALTSQLPVAVGLQEPQGVTSLKMAFFIVTAVKTSNLTDSNYVRSEVFTKHNVPQDDIPHTLRLFAFSRCHWLLDDEVGKSKYELY
jgi:hypothetical protein